MPKYKPTKSSYNVAYKLWSWTLKITISLWYAEPGPALYRADTKQGSETRNETVPKTKLALVYITQL